MQHTEEHRQELRLGHELAVAERGPAHALDEVILVAVAHIGTGPCPDIRKRMLGILFLGFRFRAKQADDQRDRLLTGQRTLQLEALLGSLENTEGLQRFGLLQRRVAMAASGGDCRYTAQEHRKQQ